MKCIKRTTLHVVNPKNPSAVNEILNLGEFWNELGLVSDKYAIINFNIIKSSSYMMIWRRAM